MSIDITLYALSTCIHCKHTKEFLDELQVTYQHTYVDKLQGEERKSTITEIKKYNPSLSFPTMVINDGEKVIIGYKQDQIKEALKS